MSRFSLIAGLILSSFTLAHTMELTHSSPPNPFKRWAEQVRSMPEALEFFNKLIPNTYQLVELTAQIEQAALAIIWQEPSQGIDITTRSPYGLLQWVGEETEFWHGVNDYLYNLSGEVRYLAEWYRSLILGTQWDEFVLTPEEMALSLIEQWKLKIWYCHSLLSPSNTSLILESESISEGQS